VIDETHAVSGLYSIKLLADKRELDTNVEDATHKKVEIVDKHGWIVRKANNQITSEVDGESNGVRTDDGDSIVITLTEIFSRKPAIVTTANETWIY